MVKLLQSVNDVKCLLFVSVITRHILLIIACLKATKEHNFSEFQQLDIFFELIKHIKFKTKFSCFKTEFPSRGINHEARAKNI